LFAAGEKPTGSRDPFGLRRAAHGVLRILLDLTTLTGIGARPTLGTLLRQAARGFPGHAEWSEWPREDIDELSRFLTDRLRHVLEERGFDRRNVRAVTWENFDDLRPAEVGAKLDALPAFASSADFIQLATAFKRVKNIARELKGDAPFALESLAEHLHESAERELLKGLVERGPAVRDAAAKQNFRAALTLLSQLGPTVDRFFVDVLVMADDPTLRRARLSLMSHLRDAVRNIADLSEVVADEKPG